MYGVVRTCILPFQSRDILCFLFYPVLINQHIFSRYVQFDWISYILYPTKKKRNSKIFPLSFPFNAKMLIVIKY